MFYMGNVIQYFTSDIFSERCGNFVLNAIILTDSEIKLPFENLFPFSQLNYQRINWK